jgi:hypothetical protein
MHCGRTVRHVPLPDIDWGEAVTYTESTTVGGKSCPQANACLNTTSPECPVTLVIDQAGCFSFYLSYVAYIIYRDSMPLGQLEPARLGTRRVHN